MPIRGHRQELQRVQEGHWEELLLVQGNYKVVQQVRGHREHENLRKNRLKKR